MPAATADLEAYEDKARPINRPTYRKKFDEQIFYVAFSPCEWSQDLLCVAFEDKVSIARVAVNDDLDFEIIAEYNHPTLCTSLALSPVTSLSVLPKILQFSTAGADFKIRVHKSDLLDSNTCQILNGHCDYINDLGYDTDTNFLASASDDQTARVWDTNTGTCMSVFYLTSPGMSVCWHAEDSVKLMVCEKIGLVRFYNVTSQQPILSLDNCCSVSSAHWNAADSQMVAALAQGELKLWDLTRPSRPSHCKIVHVEMGGTIRFSPSGDMIATVNPLLSNLKVIQLQNGQFKLNVPMLLPTNVTWHHRLSMICIGDDRELCFWRVD